MVTRGRPSAPGELRIGGGARVENGMAYRA